MPCRVGISIFYDDGDDDKDTDDKADSGHTRLTRQDSKTLTRHLEQTRHLQMTSSGLTRPTRPSWQPEVMVDLTLLRERLATGSPTPSRWFSDPGYLRSDLCADG